MPTRRNPLFSGNDPYIAQGFANISKIFEPPSATDTYAYAKAAETRAKMQRVADLYGYVTDPAFDREGFDRRAIAGGLYNPSQSYHAVGVTDATNRRNADVKAGTDLTVAGMKERGETDRALLTPVAEGATRFVPKTIADFYGTGPTQVGTLSANRGETVRAPDGQVLNGAPMPKTEAEVKGGLLAGMSPEMQQAIMFGSTPIETAPGPDGRPRAMTRPQVLDAGVAPISDKQPQVANYKAPDGRTGTAMFDPARGWVDSQTRVPLPAGSQTYTAQLSGDKTATGLGPTTANATSANNRAAEAQRALATLDLYEGLIKQNPGALGIVGLVRGTAQNAAASVADIGAQFGKDAPQVQALANDVRSGLQRVAPAFFDPSIPEAEFLQGTLAYSLARTENPSGEVSRQAFDRALERVRGGGLLANSQSALAAVGAFRQQLQAEIDAIGTLRNPGQARTDTSFQGQGQDLPVVASPEEAAMLAPGTRFRTPDGNVRVVPQ